MKCYLFCLGYKGYFVLQELVRLNKLELICGVVSCEDTTQESYFENIKEICLKNNVKFFHKTMLNKIDKNKIAIAIAWRWIIKDFSQVIVMHDSLLPRYRGFNPLVTSLINGDECIGVSILYGINEYDKGDIIAQRKLNISYPITIWEAILKISYLYAELCVEILEKISKGQKILGVPQEQKKRLIVYGETIRIILFNGNGVVRKSCALLMQWDSLMMEQRCFLVGMFLGC